MNNISTFKSCFNAGDLISFIPAMKQHYIETENKALFYLQLNAPIRYFDTTVHPIQSEKEMVSLNKEMFDFLKPLFLAQDFIYDVQEWKGEETKIDFDKLREAYGIMPFGSLNRWMFYIYSDLSFDLTQQYIFADCKAEENRRILVANTGRYKNYFLNYFFLKKHEHEISFVGLPQEHEDFCKQFELNIPYLRVENALHLAVVINQCRFFVSNQTMAFQIAEGLKVPRLLERSPELPNVIPIGKLAFDAHFQLNLEERFQYLYNKTKQA